MSSAPVQAAPTVIVTTPSELAALVRSAVADALAGRGADAFCDRRTSPVSKRAWDRYAGAADGWPAYLDGRRKVARRADVMAWLERTRRIVPAAAAAAEVDEDELALERAGIRLRAVGRKRR